MQIEIDIEPTDKVERIKERVEEKEGIPPQQQRLIFSGKQMLVCFKFDLPCNHLPAMKTIFQISNNVLLMFPSFLSTL